MTVAAPSYELFDIVGDEPRTRTSRRAGTRMGGDVGPIFARQYDERPIRTFEVAISRARGIEMKRLRDLWAQTRFGAIPMRYVPFGEAEVLVAFADPKLVWQQLNSSTASFNVKLEEVLGG